MRLAEAIITERLKLATLETAAAAGPYVRWLMDPAVIRFLEVRHYRHNKESLEGFIEASNASPDTLLLGIHLRSDGRHVGNIKLGPVDGVNRRSEIGLLIGEADCRGKKIGREAIAAMTRHAFDVLDLRKVTAGYLEPNIASGAAFAAVGYVEEARIPQQFLFEGYWVADVRMGCLRPETRSAAG